MRRPNLSRLTLVAVALAALAALAFLARSFSVGRVPLRFEKTVTAMGTFVTVCVYAPGEDPAAAAVDAALAEVARLEHLLSHFDPDSDVSKINRAPYGAAVAVSQDTIECLTLAYDVSRRTAGAFDVTVGPLVMLWKNAGKSGVLPTPDEIAAVREKVSYEPLLIDPDARTVTLRKDGVTLDLSAVAKGFIMDKAAAVLRARGISAGFVNGGGDMAFIGQNPGGAKWRVGVADPFNPSAVVSKLFVPECGVVTSGNYQQFSRIQGKHYSHIIDPRTGWALDGDSAPASVTVVARDAGAADAWATALSVLGRDGLKPAQDAGVDFLMYFANDGKLVSFESPGMAQYMK